MIMSVRKAPRQSTTQKISKKFWGVLRTLTRVENEISGGGCIIRHKGVEYGCIEITPEGVAKTLEGVDLDLTKCSIRKGLV